MANTFIFDDDEPQPTDMGTSEPEPTESEQPEGGEGNNRTFLIAAIILGGVVLLSLICMAVLAVFWLPGQNAAKLSAQETSVVAFTQTAFVNQQTQEAAAFTPTLQPTETTSPVPTETPVVVFATSTPSGVPSSDPATATVQALQTQLAAAQASTTAKAVVSGTPEAAGTPGKSAALGTTGTGTPGAVATSQLARTGFADEVGLPGLFILSIILVAVILLARRMRQTPLSH
jgi:hypothetical protein